READALAQRQVAAGTPTQRVLLTVGSLEQTPPPGTPPARAAGLRARAQVDGVRALAERLATVPGVECTLRELAGETHGSSALPALQRAVDFVLGPRA